MTRDQDRLRATSTETRLRAPRDARFDILALALACAFPTEARLEALLDRIEALP